MSAKMVEYSAVEEFITERGVSGISNELLREKFDIDASHAQRIIDELWSVGVIEEKASGIYTLPSALFCACPTYDRDNCYAIRSGNVNSEEVCTCECHDKFDEWRATDC